MGNQGVDAKEDSSSSPSPRECSEVRRNIPAKEYYLPPETDRQKWDRLVGNMIAYRPDQPPKRPEHCFPASDSDSTGDITAYLSTDTEQGNTSEASNSTDSATHEGHTSTDSESVGNAASVSTGTISPTDSSTNGSETRIRRGCDCYDFPICSSSSCVTRGVAPAPIDYSKVKTSGQTAAVRPIAGRLPASIEKSISSRRQKTSMAVNRLRQRGRLDVRHGAKRSS